MRSGVGNDIMGLRVLVCGGRSYKDRAAVYAALNAHDVALVIHGAATGADALAAEWAVLHGIELLRFHARWSGHGSGAGMVRNAQMLHEGKPDLVLAFPGASGTHDMVRKALAAGVPVQFVLDDTMVIPAVASSSFPGSAFRKTLRRITTRRL